MVARRVWTVRKSAARNGAKALKGKEHATAGMGTEAGVPGGAG
jgi:hypothetical protein